ncbi:MAG: hypothetical protein U0X75_28980 [Acidobacteriota bacterium]
MGKNFIALLKVRSSLQMALLQCGSSVGFGGYGPGTVGTQIIALLHEVAHNVVVPLGNGMHKFLIENDGNDAEKEWQQYAKDTRKVQRSSAQTHKGKGERTCLGH